MFTKKFDAIERARLRHIETGKNYGIQTIVAIDDMSLYVVEEVDEELDECGAYIYTTSDDPYFDVDCETDDNWDDPDFQNAMLENDLTDMMNGLMKGTIQ
jgi:hypothetical protein